MPTYIVLLGPPGAGKGTQAKRLASQLNIPHISSGDLFRAMKTMDTPLARKVQEIMKTGALVDDQTTIDVFEPSLARDDVRANGAILDGFPRNAAQADWLKQYLAEQGSTISVVLLMDVPKEIVLQRLLKRAKEENRPDDTPEVVEKRYEDVYVKDTMPLIDYYQLAGLLKTVNGDQAVDTVTSDLLKAIPANSTAG
jgi:adenylate kinase